MRGTKAEKVKRLFVWSGFSDSDGKFDMMIAVEPTRALTDRVFVDELFVETVKILFCDIVESLRMTAFILLPVKRLEEHVTREQPLDGTTTLSYPPYYRRNHQIDKNIPMKTYQRYHGFHWYLGDSKRINERK